jgi:phytanoyl-CoA dioxygenase PhyH
MHRERTHLVSRATRVAKALERRGIATTYNVHDRAFANRQSRRLLSSHRVELDPLQRRIVDALDADGYIVVSFDELVPDDGTRARVLAEGDAFIAETERALADEAAVGAGLGLRRRAGKEFVVRAHSFDGVTLDPAQNAWFATCVSRRVLDVANAYLRMWAKLTYVDLWYTAPQPPGAERAASQLWHRDFDDKHLLKVFLYLVDVDEDAGPFEYVAGSQPGGRHREPRQWGPMQTGRFSEEEVANHVPTDEIKTFTAPRGTMIFCNTSGLHRGGFATAHPRALATATYCSPASLKALSVRNYSAADASADRVVRFATT